MGALGTLVDVISPAANRLPLCALVRFDTYEGPAFFAEDPKVVPITPTTANFGASSAMSRTNLPLILAWAMTIHKSQGATYERAVASLVLLESREFDICSSAISMRVSLRFQIASFAMLCNHTHMLLFQLRILIAVIAILGAHSRRGPTHIFSEIRFGIAIRVRFESAATGDCDCTHTLR